MTTRIYLLRHGIAVPHGTPGVAEDDRPLTPQGERRVKQIAAGLDRLGVAPDRIVTSPLPRARRTAEIVVRKLGLDDRLETADALTPRASAASIREWLRTREDASLMLVGHNPNLTELLGLLIGVTADPLPFELKKAGVAALSARGEGQDGFTLDWLAAPRLLRKLGD